MTEKQSSEFDVVVIGGGPGGYVAAIRAAQLGLKTACIEGRGSLGGTCLNVGCIPSKALLHASEQVAHARHSFADWGIKVGGVEVDVEKMMDKKEEVVHGLTSGIELLLAKNKVTYLQGWAALGGEGRVEVKLSEGGDAVITAKNIILATGSEVTPLPGIEIDEERIVSSTGALELQSVPEHLVVIGGGVIGLEMGSVWQRLGAKVTVVEFLDRICPGMDNEIAKTFQKTLEGQGMAFKLGHKVTAAKNTGEGVELSVEPSAGGDAESMNADVVLVAIGRRPFTSGLGLEAVGVETDKQGRVIVDGGFQTSVKGVFAIGDVIDGPMLAHKAEKEGVAVAEIIAGNKQIKVDYNTVPGIVYTAPEVANIGFSEQELKDAGVAYKVGKFPFKANSRARAMEETDGLVKLLAHKDNGRILGAHIISKDAGTLIHEVAAVMEFGGTYDDLIHIIHGHPTLNEAVKEAAMAIDKRAIHV